MKQYKVEINNAGAVFWYNSDGKLHREGGPAVEWFDGDKSWWIDGKFHRDNGPAIEFSSGTKSWYVNGKKHRLNGPAIEWHDGTKEWWVDGVEYSEREFNKKFLKRSTCEGRVVEIEGVKYKLTLCK